MLIKYGNVARCAIIRAQKDVALSSTEAGYNALADWARLIAWLGKMLKILNVVQQTTTIAEDNSGTIGWANGRPAKHFARRKHVDIELNYIMEQVHKREVNLMKVASADMLADFLTKPMAQDQFEKAISPAELSRENK